MMKQIKTILAVLLFIGCSFVSFSEAILSPQSVVSLEFGDAPSKLGSSGSGEDDWKPLFFSVSEDGSIAVPDVNKGRIVLYSAKGVFIKAFPVDTAISPRMNYFAQSRNGCYVSFNDGALYCLTGSGSLLWRAPFPMGVFPKALYAGDDAVYFTVEEDDGVKSFSIPYIPPFTAAESVVSADGGTYSRTGVPAKARFLEANKNGRAVWLEKEEDAYAVYLTTADGKLISSGRIAWKPSASWYWAVAKFEGKQTAVYVYEEDNGAMRIEKYLLQ